jgi:hypothetical protein
MRSSRSLLGAVVLALAAPVLVPASAAAAPAGIAWTPCGALQPVPAGVRDRTGAPGLVPAARPDHLAGSHAAPGHRPGPAHRLAAGQPGRAWRLWGDEVAARGAHLDALTGGRFDVVGWDPRGSNRRGPVSCFATAAERAAFWADVLVPTTRAEQSAARRVERRLGNAVLLVQDGYGHLTAKDPSTCVNAALGTYLVHRRAPARGTARPSDHVPFDPAFGQS